ncbi:MAG: hypothetical protein Fur0012_12680 [Elusimicrobiota bacterium]
MKAIYLSTAFIALSSLCFSQERRSQGEESLFLNMQKVGLGQLSDVEEKKKFLETVQLEKQKLQYSMLQSVYENAYELYRDGDYQSARDMAARILSIDPSFDDARMLKEAAENLKGSSNPKYSEKVMIEDKFKEALSLYQEGSVLKAYKQMNEVVKLSPNNIKARYWLEKMKEDLKDYYLNQGDEEYKKGNLKDALNSYYNALSIKPKDERIVTRISSLEEELRNQMLNEKLKAALEVYARGDIQNAYKMLQSAMQINPGDTKANKLFREVKREIENGYIDRGKAFYSKKNYNLAIAEWNKARPYSDSVSYLDKLVNAAKEQIAKEEKEKKRREEEAARKAREAEEKKKKQEEEKKKKQMMGQPTADDEEQAKKKKVTEQNKMAAQQHYLDGLKEFQNSNYQKARDEFTIAKQLDPTNTDIDSALKRIEQIMSSGQ